VREVGFKLKNERYEHRQKNFVTLFRLFLEYGRYMNSLLECGYSIIYLTEEKYCVL